MIRTTMATLAEHVFGLDVHCIKTVEMYCGNGAAYRIGPCRIDTPGTYRASISSLQDTVYLNVPARKIVIVRDISCMRG